MGEGNRGEWEKKGSKGGREREREQKAGEGMEGGNNERRKEKELALPIITVCQEIRTVFK